MKYIKVSVPDDFDPAQGHKILLDGPENGECPVWQPHYVDVLDKGFLGLLEFMGDDQAVVDAARVSYGAGTKRVQEDRGLIRYLMRHRHTTPFEMVELKFHAKLPIFVARQWVRHRTASINEYSGRYSVMSDDVYLPELEALKPQSSANKQGRDGELSQNNAYACQLQMHHIFTDSNSSYHYLLGEYRGPSASLNQRISFIEEFAIQRIKDLEKTDPDWAPDKVTEEMIEAKVKEIMEANGIAATDKEFWNEGLSRELARIVLTLSTYTEMYWKCDLKNTLNFISLRSDPHAQYEIKAYSDAMLEMIQPLVPNCIEAFLDYQMRGRSFSAAELDVVKKLYQISEVGPSIDKLVEEMMLAKGASKREIKEFIEVLSR